MATAAIAIRATTAPPPWKKENAEPGVLDEPELQESVDERDRAVGQGAHGEPLGHLIEQHHRPGDGECDVARGQREAAQSTHCNA